MRSVPEESKLKGPYVSILLILCELVKFLQDREVYYPMCYAMNAGTAGVMLYQKGKYINA